KRRRARNPYPLTCVHGFRARRFAAPGMTSSIFRLISLVAVDALAALVALLRFDRQGRDGACLKALDRDWLAGLLAEPGRAVLDARQRFVDLCDQFALAVTSAQLDRPVGLRRGAVGEIRVILILVLEVLEGLPCLPENIFPPCEQLLPEIVALTIIHERLFVG